MNNTGQCSCPHRPKWAKFYKLMNIMRIPETESIGNISSIIGEDVIDGLREFVYLRGLGKQILHHDFHQTSRI